KAAGLRCKGLGYGFCADFLVKSGLIHRCLQFNQAEISGYWRPSGADMPLSGDLGNHDQLYPVSIHAISRFYCLVKGVSH
uniref:hypothetical protein n=1 Tax=Thiolapillus sp. TaxID=2017437 RepID=UPI003AF5584C